MNTQELETDTVTLYDAYCCAYLIGLGGTLKEVTEDGWIVIEDTAGMNGRALHKWKYGGCMIEARKFTDALKSVRAAQRRKTAMVRGEGE